MSHHTKQQSSKRRRSNANCPESWAAHIIEATPSNKLKSFSFMHSTPISSRLLNVLSSRHEDSLRALSCYSMGCLSAAFLPSSLQSLECRSIDDGRAYGKLVHANKDTLRLLRLGQEEALVTEYHNTRMDFYEALPQPLPAFQSVVGLSDISNLRRLCLTGLNVSPLVPLNIEDALYLTHLEELVLESCPASEALVSAIASIFSFSQSEIAPEPRSTPRLQKFIFRTEACSAMLKDALIRLLNSFSGLQILSLLFENGYMSERVASLLPRHGATLEKLVLDSRIQPRESLRLDTSRPFGMGGYSQQLWEESHQDICRLCPDLSELSIGFPWKDELVRLRPSLLPNLPLRAMQIRNFPESHSLAQMGDYSVKEHALKFLDWTYGNIQGGHRPQLETLTIGPAIYESRFKGSNPDRRPVPEFLRPHHFTIDWAQTRFGRWSAMVTAVSERYMEELRGEKPLAGIFEPLWLK